MLLLAFSRQRPWMLLNILQCTGQAPTTNNCPGPNVNSAEVQKLCCRKTKCTYFTKRMELLCGAELLNMPYICCVFCLKCPFLIYAQASNLHHASPSPMSPPRWRSSFILPGITDLPKWFCGNIHEVQSEWHWPEIWIQLTSGMYLGKLTSLKPIPPSENCEEKIPNQQVYH